MTQSTKLHQLQSTIGVLTKDTTNEFYHCKYFDINKLIRTLKPLLDELKIGITQPLEFIDGRTVLATYVTDIETGKHLLESKIALPDINEPQKIGSTITYYRRYSLQTSLFLEAEDDDGNSTVPPVKKAPVATKVNAQGTPEEVVPQVKCNCGGTMIKKEGIKNGASWARIDCTSCKKGSWLN